MVSEHSVNHIFGKRLCRLRKEKGYTQQVFSEMIGLTPNYLSDIERGNSFPSPEKLVTIANTLDCSADDLFCDLIRRFSPARTSVLGNKIDGLPMEKQQQIFAVLDAYLQNL